MSEISKGYKWSQAAVKGLLLALITIACNTVTYLFPDSGFLSMAMFIVRTVASVWLLVVFMKQYAAATDGSAMNFALCTVLLSSLICAFYDAAAYAWLFPNLAEKVTEAMDASFAQFPAEGQAIAERMMDHFPRIAFFSSFIKDFLFGLIVAAIANSSTTKKDIFADGNKEDELA
jgi:hypothetical protein